MKINKWITMAAAAMMLIPAVRADDWWTQRACWGNGDNGQLFRANEGSIDLFGLYKDRERHFLAWPNTEIKHGLWGGGIGGNYFFTRELGISADAGFLANAPQHIADHVGGNLVVRIPIDQVHLAPYFFGGGGRCWNPSDNWFADVGVGLEFRFNPYVGLFGDASYIWKNHGAQDQAAIRAGLRFVF